jgi:predicted nucleic acid-binding protein
MPTTSEMPFTYLDTNPIIRLLTGDHPEHAPRARALFERAARGELTLHLSEAVVVEVVNVLSSRALYHLPRPEIEQLLKKLFALPGVNTPGKRTYQRALELWVQHLPVQDFVDCLQVAHMERLKIPAIASFDTDFDRFPQITRLVP